MARVDVYITAGLSVRLGVNGNARAGRLEIYYNGQWGTVCDDSFDNKDAKVACYMLGFGYGVAVLFYFFNEIIYKKFQLG